MYSLDTETMLQLAQNYQQTGLFFADLPPGAAGTRFPCRASMNMLDGTLIDCRIETLNGRTHLVGREALQELHRFGILEWNLSLPPDTSTNSRTTSPTSIMPYSPRDLATTDQPTDGNMLIPTRTVNVSPGQMAEWPRLYRKVYFMVDGKNTVEKIADILSLPVVTVEKVIRDLSSMRVITIEQ